jgi:hypothetical protein
MKTYLVSKLYPLNPKVPGYNKSFPAFETLFFFSEDYDYGPGSVQTYTKPAIRFAGCEYNCTSKQEMLEAMKYLIE